MQPEHESKSEFPSIGGQYRLTEKLGEGAFGEVYRAHHDLLDQDFAVKLLRPELSEDQDVRDRFLDEARALIRFSHPNVVQMRHVGEHGGRLYLVMDLVQGKELGQVLREEGAFGEVRAVNVILQVLSGLEAAHAAGITHRDLKPSNLILEKQKDGSERVRILDFGLSKLSTIDGVAGAHRSVTGTIIGTLAYMSPEQIRGETVDGRSDVFAAGLVLMEMIQGHHPYPGESGIVVAAKLLRDPIPPLEPKRASKVADSTRSAISQALERDRDARFASATSFAQALRGKGPPSDTSRVTTVLEAQRELARQDAARERESRSKGAKRRKALAVVAVLVLVLGAAAFFVLGDRGASTQGAGDNGKPVQVAEDHGTKPPQPPSHPGGNREDPATPPGPGAEEPGATPPAQPPVQPPALPPVQPPVEPATEPATEPGAVPAQPGPGEQPGHEFPAPETPGPETPQPETPQPETPQPATPEPETPRPETPEPGPAAGGSPGEAVEKAAPLLGAGRFAAARGLFLQALSGAKLEDAIQVAALRGAAASYVGEADVLARSGRPQEAVALLAEAVAWLTRQHQAYERVKDAVDVVRLQLGFARTHRAEARVERARWLGLLGKRAEALQALKAADDDFEFAFQSLKGDSVNYWEYLIRRATKYRLQGDFQRYIDDLAYTTQTRNTEVPAHMWVAHAAGARRLAEVFEAKGDAAQALDWAQKASKIAEDGVSWQDTALTRQQWLDMARVLFVCGRLLPASEDPTALHGKIGWWTTEAGKAPAAADLPPDVAEARLLIGQAMARYLQGRVHVKHGKQADATQVLEEGAGLAAKAIGLLESVASGGGLLPDGLAYEVHAAILAALGRGAEARAAQAAAAKANARNPD